MTAGPIRVLSLGAGVQSSTLALMLAAGEVPMVDCAIFADTQAEPAAVYSWLDWLEKQLPFPVHRVTKGHLGEDQLRFSTSKDGHGYLRNIIPAFTLNPDNSVGMLLRKCTGDYKLAPIRRKVRELVGDSKRHVHQLIGISLDEALRQKPSGVKYITNAYPLIEMNMTRGHCLEWMSKQGYAAPPKSACTFCPYHNDAQWASLTAEELAGVAGMEREWNRLAREDKGKTQTRGIIRFHRSLKPIDQVDFGAKHRASQVDMFTNECEGMCGV